MKLYSTLIWIFTIIFTLCIAVYQRLTGPTHPVRDSVIINNTEVKYKLLRSAENDESAKIIFKDIDQNISGKIKYKRFNIKEDWIEKEFQLIDNDLIAELPPQPMAGKLEYIVWLSSNGIDYQLNNKPIVIRFKGPVPKVVLIPHIFLMFLAMLWSTRTGLEVLFNRSRIRSYTFITMILLLFGGMILGPIVQEYAFGDFWTGWPFGQDLTDNKTLVAFIFWVVAYLGIRKNTRNKWWALAASIVLLLVYLIPHSMFGSELDYSTGEVVTG